MSSSAASVGIDRAKGRVDDHFKAHHHEHKGQAILEVVEAVDDAYQGEEQRPQAQDGEDVGRVDQKRVLGDGEDGRDGVQGEDNVGNLHQREHNEQRRDEPDAVLAHHETLAHVIRRDAEVPAHELRHTVAGQVRLVVDGHEHLDAGDDEEGAEDVDDPVEGGENGRPRQDERRAHYEGTQHAPEQHRVLRPFRHLEMCEDEHEHEDVVDASGSSR